MKFRYNRWQIFNSRRPIGTSIATVLLKQYFRVTSHLDLQLTQIEHFGYTCPKFVYRRCSTTLTSFQLFNLLYQLLATSKYSFASTISPLLFFQAFFQGWSFCLSTFSILVLCYPSSPVNFWWVPDYSPSPSFPCLFLNFLFSPTLGLSNSFG